MSARPAPASPGTVVAALVAAAMAAGGVYWGYRIFAKSRAVESWPVTPGYVMESRIAWKGRPGRSGGGIRYQVLSASFAYTVAGRHYLGEQVSPEGMEDRKWWGGTPESSPPDEWLLDAFRRIPAGTVVPVRHNPADAAEGYLFAGPGTWEVYLGPVALAGGGMLVLALIASALGLAASDRQGARAPGPP